MNKKTIKHLFFSIFCLKPLSLVAIIHECPSMQEVRPIVKQQKNLQNVLYAFDLDNTVFEPAGIKDFDPTNKLQLGSDQWFNAVFYFLQTHPEVCHNQTPIKRAVYLYTIAHALVQVKPVERDMITLIHELVTAGIPTMALTTKSKPLKNITMRQLRTINVAFSLKILKNNQDISFVPEKKDLFPGLLSQSILFCSDSSKGFMLSKLIRILQNKKHWTPKTVICLDDKRHHLEKIEQALKKFKNIDFIGIRYGKLDQKVAQYKRQNLFNPRTLTYLEKRAKRLHGISYPSLCACKCNSPKSINACG